MASNNSMKVNVEYDASKLIDGAKKSQQAIKEVGVEVTKTDKSFKSIKTEINQNQKDLNKLINEYRILKQRLGESAAATQDAKSKMDAKIATLSRLKAEEQQVSNQVKIATQNIINQGNAAQQATTKINAMSGSMSRLGKLGGMTSSLSMLGSMVGIPTGALSSVSMMTSSLGSMSGAASGATAAMGGLSAASLGVAAAVAAAGLVLYKAGKSAHEFDVTLNTLKADLRLSEDATKRYGDAAIELSNKYGKSTTDIVKGFQAIADSSPGLEKDEQAMIKVADAANKLSIALGTDLDASTKVVTTAMSKFNIEAGKSQEVINQIAEITRNSGASLEYVQTVFDKTGSAAQQAGIDMGSIGSATSVLSTKFNDASQVGTGLSMMIKKLTTQGKSEFNPAIVGMDTALQNLADAHLTAAEAQKMFGTRGRDVAMTLIEMNDQFQATEQKMRDTAAAEEMFGIKSAELGNVINRIKEIWSNLMIKIGESSAFQALMGIISELMNWFEELSLKIQEAFDGDAFDGYADMLDGIKEALSAILPIISEIIVVFMKAYNIIYKALGFIIKMVAALHTAIAKGLIAAWNWLKNTVSNVYNAIKGWITNLYNQIKNIAPFKVVIEWVGKIGDKFWNVINKIKSWWNDMIKTLVGMWNKLMDGISSLGFDMSGYKLNATTNHSSSGGGAGSSGVSGGAVGAVTNNDSPTGGNGSGGHGGGGHSSSSGGGAGSSGVSGGSNKPQYQEGSLAYYEAKVNAINDALKNQKLTEEQINEKIAERIKWEKIIDDIKQSQQRVIDKAKYDEISKIQISSEAQEELEKHNKEINDLLKKGNLTVEERNHLLTIQLSIEQRSDQLKASELLNDKQINKTLAQKKQFVDDVNKLLSSGNLTLVEQHRLLKKSVEYQRELDKAKQHQDNLKAIMSFDTTKFVGPQINISKKISGVDIYGEKMYDAGVQALQKLQQLYDKHLISKEAFIRNFDTIIQALNSKGYQVDIKPRVDRPEWQKQLDNTAGALQQVGDVMGQIGDTTQNQALNIAGTIAQAIASIWLGFSEALAADKSTKSNVFLFLGAALAGVATMIGVVSQIKGNQYAQGGIVTGNSAVGDKLYARLNGGEMVMNNRQQHHLWNVINGTQGVNNGTHLTTAEVVIRGDKMYALLSNTAKIKSLTGKNIGIK